MFVGGFELACSKLSAGGSLRKTHCGAAEGLVPYVARQRRPTGDVAGLLGEASQYETPSSSRIVRRKPGRGSIRLPGQSSLPLSRRSARQLSVCRGAQTAIWVRESYLLMALRPWVHEWLYSSILRVPWTMEWSTKILFSVAQAGGTQICSLIRTRRDGIQFPFRHPFVPQLWHEVCKNID